MRPSHVAGQARDGGTHASTVRQRYRGDGNSRQDDHGHQAMRISVHCPIHAIAVRA
jgi:hypothetical protein